MSDLDAMDLDELVARHHELYSRVQQPGCPREVVLEYDQISDELDARRPAIDIATITCTQRDDDIEAEWGQPPGPEWGA